MPRNSKSEHHGRTPSLQGVGHHSQRQRRTWSRMQSSTRSNVHNTRRLGAASSSQADASQVSMMMQMMSLMQEQNRQQAVLLDAVTRRLDALEASRGPPGGGMVPPPPPGISASMVQQGGCQASGGISFPADGKPPFGVNLPVADYKSWHSRLQELLGYRTWFESFLSWINLISERYAREIHEANYTHISN